MQLADWIIALCAGIGVGLLTAAATLAAIAG